MPASADRRESCTNKIAFHTMAEAQATVDELERDVIYDRYKPQLYVCRYARHFHVGHHFTPEGAMPPTKTYSGPTVVINFTTLSKAGEVLGVYRGETVYPWSGHPRPQFGERWECEVLSQWTAGLGQGSHWGGGVLVHPLRLLGADHDG